MGRLERLPIELLCMIGHQLHTIDRLCLALTCKKMACSIGIPRYKRDATQYTTMDRLVWQDRCHQRLSYDGDFLDLLKVMFYFIELFVTHLIRAQSFAAHDRLNSFGSKCANIDEGTYLLESCWYPNDFIEQYCDEAGGLSFKCLFIYRMIRSMTWAAEPRHLFRPYFDTHHQQRTLAGGYLRVFYRYLREVKWAELRTPECKELCFKTFTELEVLLLIARDLEGHPWGA